MGTINFSSGKYGSTYIIEEFWDAEYDSEHFEDEQEYDPNLYEQECREHFEEIYETLKEKIEDINWTAQCIMEENYFVHEVYNYLGVSIPPPIAKVEPGYYDGLSIYMDIDISNENIHYVGITNELKEKLYIEEIKNTFSYYEYDHSYLDKDIQDELFNKELLLEDFIQTNQKAREYVEKALLVAAHDFGLIELTQNGYCYSTAPLDKEEYEEAKTFCKTIEARSFEKPSLFRYLNPLLNQYGDDLVPLLQALPPEKLINSQDEAYLSLAMSRPSVALLEDVIDRDFSVNEIREIDYALCDGFSHEDIQHLLTVADERRDYMTGKRMEMERERIGREKGIYRDEEKGLSL